MDALRADRVGAHPAAPDEPPASGGSLTPAIDALAEEGTLFTRAFTASNTTEASVTSMHTGHHPLATVYNHSYRVTDAERRRVAAATTLPEALSAAGIRTVAAAPAMGRWHRDGFDVFDAGDGHPHRLKRLYWRLKARNTWVANRFRWCYLRVAGALRRARGPVRRLGRRLRDGGAAGGSDGADGSDVAGATDRDPVDRLLDHLDHPDGGPFYGFVRLVDTHVPYEPDPSLIDQLHGRRDYPEGDLAAVLEDAPEGGFLDTAVAPTLTERDRAVGLSRLCARYDATVVEADRAVARLRAGLEAAGHWEDTAVVVCADHGESLVEHGIYADHHGLYDETMHVPLVVHLPGDAGDGGVRDELVQLPDLAPTVAALLGVDADLGSFGRSLTPLLGGPAADTAAADTDWTPREFAFAEEAWAQRRFAVRTRSWKYVQHRPEPALPDEGRTCRYCERAHDDPPELFDLSADPDETTDVAAERPAVVERMERAYRGLERSLPALDPGGATPSDPDEEAVVDRLEALGYR